MKPVLGFVFKESETERENKALRGEKVNSLTKRNKS